MNTDKNRKKQRLVESDVKRVGDGSSAVQLMVGMQFGAAACSFVHSDMYTVGLSRSYTFSLRFDFQ